MFDLLTGELHIVCKACATAYAYRHSVHVSDPAIPDAFCVDFTPAGPLCAHLAAHVQVPGALLLLTPAAQQAFLRRVGVGASIPPQPPPLPNPHLSPIPHGALRPIPAPPAGFPPPARPHGPAAGDAHGDRRELAAADRGADLAG